eukprot:scaffold23746_cov44-Phaeocystis_antarctica.AAC.4
MAILASSSTPTWATWRRSSSTAAARSPHTRVCPATTFSSRSSSRWKHCPTFARRQRDSTPSSRDGPPLHRRSSTYYGSTYCGSPYNGSTYYGSAYCGSTYYGSPYCGSTYYGSPYCGSTYCGSTNCGSTY